MGDEPATTEGATRDLSAMTERACACVGAMRRGTKGFLLGWRSGDVGRCGEMWGDVGRCGGDGSLDHGDRPEGDPSLNGPRSRLLHHTVIEATSSSLVREGLRRAWRYGEITHLHHAIIKVIFIEFILVALAAAARAVVVGVGGKLREGWDR